MRKIDPTLSRGDTTRAIVQNKIKFQEFYEKHCRDRHYHLSVKKCNDLECKFHLAPNTPDFDKIQHIPDPDPNGERYKSFSKLHGTKTTERYRPSLTTQSKPSKGMPFDPTKQTALNVGQVIQCDDCGEWRLLHAE